MTIDRFHLAMGILWTVVVGYFLLSLFPPLLRVHQRWEVRFKSLKRGAAYLLSWWQRLVFVLLSGLMTVQIYFEAFHRDFCRATGIPPRLVSPLMLLLAAIFFLLPFVERRFAQKR